MCVYDVMVLMVSSTSIVQVAAQSSAASSGEESIL